MGWNRAFQGAMNAVAAKVRGAASWKEVQFQLGWMVSVLPAAVLGAAAWVIFDRHIVKAVATPCTKLT